MHVAAYKCLLMAHLMHSLRRPLLVAALGGITNAWECSKGMGAQVDQQHKELVKRKDKTLQMANPGEKLTIHL